MSEEDTYICDIESLIEHKPLLKPEIVKKFIFLDNFNILCLNARSLRDKFASFQILLKTLNINFSLIVITESWFLEHEFLNQYELDGYNIFCDSRTKNRGGGVCVYVSQKFEARVEPARLEGAESLAVEMWYHGSRMFSALCIYRAPSGELSAFFRGLDPIMESLPSGSVVLGDMNIDLNPNNDSYNETTVKRYINLLNSTGFANTIITPTRFGLHKNSMIDHILINSLTRKIKTCTVDYVLSDHQPCVASIKTNHRVLKPKNNKVRESINYCKLSELVNMQDWHQLFDHNDACTSVQNFQATLSSLIKESTTRKQIFDGKQSFKKPWMTAQLLQLTRKRTKMHNELKKQPFNTKLQTEYTKFRNDVTNQINNAKRKFYLHEFDNCKSNNNDKWKFINNLLNKKTENPTTPSLEENGKILSDPLEICEVFNEYFVHVGTKLAAQLPESNQSFNFYLPEIHANQSFRFEKIDSSDVIREIKNFKLKKASGYDSISARCMKENTHVLAPILTNLLNQMFEQSVFPDCLKIAKVIPLFKKGAKTNATNYRPISILSILSKLAEKIMSSQIRGFLESNNVLSMCQYGFRPGRSTSQAISNLLEIIYSKLDSSDVAQTVFLDYSKAFDTINHDILLEKLKHYNFDDGSRMLLKSYLTNRKQFVNLNNVSSGYQNISIGVPQGSVLGPLLFLIYINDLTLVSSNFNFILFADDTNLISKNPSITACDLNIIKDWCLSNKLILNESKTCQMIFHNHQKKLNTNNFEQRNLEIVVNTKFLGIFLDQHLNFVCHINAVVRKLNFLLMMLRFLRKFLNDKSMVDVYYSFIYPHLIYGLEFWGHAPDYALEQVLICQKKALRIICCQPPNSSISHQFANLKIMPIYMLFKYRSLIFFHNQISNDINLKVSLKVNNTTCNLTRDRDNGATTNKTV